MNLCGKSLISLKDFTPQEIRYFLDVAKKAKDAAAGAVLVSAILAAIIGLLIFIPRLFEMIHLIAG